MAMLADTVDRPGVEEMYESSGAGHQAIVGAAGMAQVATAEGYRRIRLGCALIRLHGEWTRAQKPAKIETPSLAVLIGKFRGVADANERARKEHGAIVASTHRQWASERMMLISNLPSREAVWRDLGPWIHEKGLDSESAARAILAWLEPACRHCGGLGYLKAKDSANLTAYKCDRCKGTGQVLVKQAGSSVLGYIRGCVAEGRQAIKKRLRNA